MAEEKRVLTPEERAEEVRRARAARWVRGYWGVRMARAATACPLGPEWVKPDDWESETRDLATRYRQIDGEDMAEYLAAPEDA